MVTLEALQKELLSKANTQKAAVMQQYFKTGEGEYGAGDLFLGISVPIQRAIARRYTELPLTELKKMFASRTHEFRFTCLEILVAKYEKADDSLKEKIFNFYLRNRQYVNNWDLVDTSVEYIVGDYLFGYDTSVLYDMARSKNIWDRRMAIMATFTFIKKHTFADALKIAALLIGDEHDLIHKAVGWMLREIGKRSLEVEEKFLAKHYKKMPRTMLHYAIERFPQQQRQKYLRGLI
jgi:3-methyladenine DNA glycosylase AlkD